MRIRSKKQLIKVLYLSLNFLAIIDWWIDTARQRSRFWTIYKTTMRSIAGSSPCTMNTILLWTSTAARNQIWSATTAKSSMKLWWTIPHLPVYKVTILWRMAAALAVLLLMIFALPCIILSEKAHQVCTFDESSHQFSQWWAYFSAFRDEGSIVSEMSGTSISATASMLTKSKRPGKKKKNKDSKAQFYQSLVNKFDHSISTIQKRLLNF